jgi:hypothetical protein
MNRIYFILLLLILSCGGDPLEKEIHAALKEKDFIKAATICAEYRGEKFQSQCSEAKTISEEEISQILHSKQDSPFMKIVIEPVKDQKIRELLKKDIYLGIKYRTIWNEISERQ